MVNWVVLDADCDEETRQAGDVGSLTSLYEVVKLAYLQPDDKLLELPRLAANASWGRVALALDSTLFIFGEGCSSLLMQMSLDAIIDIIVWIPTGDFLILGDRNGGVHCVHVESQQVLITKQVPAKGSHGKLFIGGGSELGEDGKASVVLITSLGMVIGMKNFDPEGLSEGMRMSDLEHLKSLEAQMTISFDEIDLANMEVKTANCLFRGNSSTWVWSGTTKGAMLWMSSSLQNPSQSRTLEIVQGSNFIRVLPIFDGRYVLMLDCNGKLSVLSGVTGLMLREVTECCLPIVDIVFIQGDGDAAQLFAVLKDKGSKGFILRIMSFPGFATIYELKVNESTSLVQYGEGTESVMFVEPDYDPNDEEIIASLKVKSIVDGVPEARLAKLLRKRKFKEAKEFCQTFELDIEEVNKAQARYLCDLMNPWNIGVSNATLNDAEFGGDLTEELLASLGNIRDAEFVTSLCVEAPLPDIITTKKVLNYAKERLANTTKSEEGDKLSSLMQRVSESTYRLRTFETIFPSSDIQHWLAFSRTDMLEEFTVHIRMGNLDVASTVWHRHLYEFRELIDLPCVSQILAAFPIDIHSSVLSSWLPRNVISDLVKICPSSMEAIANWADKRVRNLEVLEKGQWPSNALGLADTIILILENVVSDFHAGGNIEVQMAVHVAQWKAHSPSSALYHLRQTSLALQDLQLLAEKFRIKIEFNEYTQGNKVAVVAALLDWLVCGEEVAPLMDGFLRSYLIRHNLNYDETLAHFVRDTLASADQDWWVWQEAQWEDKVYAVINVIADVQLRVECIVECIHVAPVPWSEGTRSMCNSALNMNTPLSSQIEDQRRLVGLKLVLRRYALHLSNIDNPQHAEFMLRNILSRDGDTIMEDALQVVATYKHLSRADAYYWRAQHLLNTGNIDLLKELLQSLDDALLKLTCQKLIMYSAQTFLSPPRGPMCKELRKAITRSLLSLEQIFEKCCRMSGTLLEDNFFSRIRDIHLLQEKYDIYPTLQGLSDAATCKKIFEEHTTKWFVNGLETQEKTSSKPGKSGDISVLELTSQKMSPKSDTAAENVLQNLDYIQRLAYLLKVPRENMLFLLASLAAKDGRFAEAVNLCRIIMEDAQVLDSSTIVQKVVKLAIEYQTLHKDEKVTRLSSVYMNSTALMEHNASVKCRSDLNNVILELISLALSFCHPDQLNSLLEVGLWCRLGQNLYNQCHVEGIYTQLNPMESSSSYVQWKFSPVYSDASMPIEDGIVTNVLTDALASWISSDNSQIGNSPPLPYLPTTQTSRSLDSPDLTGHLINLSSHLCERGHDMLTISISLLLSQHGLLFGDNSSSSSIVCSLGYQQILNILLKIIGSKKPDVTVGVSLLTLITKKDASKVLNELIRRFGSDYAKLMSVAILGKDYCTLNGIKETWEKFDVLYKRSSWGKRLSEINISFKEAFKDVKALINVLGDIVAHPECSFSLIYEYCEDFGLDVTDAFILHLKTTLQSWSPEVPVGERRPGAALQIEPPRSVFSKCQSILAEIKNKSQLKQMLAAELESLSSYNYELLELVLQQLVLLHVDQQEIQVLNRGLDIINFLRVYTRRIPPGDVEVDEWVNTHPQSLGPPEIAKFRLPFHDLFKRSKSMKKIIEAEMNISTIDIWLQAAPTLKLNSDQLCMIATQNTVSDTLEQESKSKANNKEDKNKLWQVCSTNGALLSKIRNVVSKIQYSELATACGNWVVNRLPPGIDKVTAAEKCKLLAEQWKGEDDSNAKAVDAFISMNNRYEQLAVEHALHKYNLAEPKYLALTRTPMELIFALYQHPALDSLATLSTHSMPNINSCVSDVCSVAGYNQVSIHLELLEKWLPPPEAGEGGGDDETVSNFQIAFEPVASEDGTSDDDASLSRVIYLLRCCPQEEAISYLLNRALSEDTSVSAALRLRALRCLLAIADEKTIQKYSGKSVAFLRNFLQTITYVSRLETLGHNTSMEKFNSMDKHALIEGLWRSQRHNPLALNLVTDLCHDYKVTTASLWGAVLTQLTNFVKLNKVEVITLERILLQVKSLPHLWVVPALTTAWTTVILHPFIKATVPIKESSLSACVHSVDLLLRHCPVVVATIPLMKHCTNLDLPVLSLAVAAADQVESHDLKAMADKTETNKLKKQYAKLKPMFSFPRNVEDLLECLV